MKTLVTIVVLACGFVMSPGAGTASAGCDSADCVPNVARNVAAGAPCTPQTFFVFGLDSASNTLICASWGAWAPTGPLIGTRDIPLPCYRLNDSAQEGNGVPVQCQNINNRLQWAHFPPG